MNKFFKKLSVCVLCAAMLCAAAGCANGKGSAEDPKFEGKNPFTLKVYNYLGGFGSEWLDALEERYEEEKMGKSITVDGVTYDCVDVKVEGVKQSMTQAQLTFQATNHVYFQESVNYMSCLRQGNIFEDMTDAMTKENPYEPGTTLESKLSEEQRNYYNRGTEDEPLYYGIPHYAAYVGITYNIDLFDSQGFYLKKDYDYDGNTANLYKCFTKQSSEKSAGPDGKSGTNDDGLPTTYDEFFMLCGYIAQYGMVPISWTGHKDYTVQYITWFLNALAANYEGLAQMNLNYLFTGTAEDLVSVDDSGNVTFLDSTPIDSETGYELAKQAGKYYGLSFLEKIIDEGWNNDGAFEQTFSQTNAQDEFILGDNEGTQSAMLMDGVWWEMEANSTFLTLEQSGLAGKNERNYGWMPLPCATEEKAEERAAKLSKGENGYTLIDMHNSLCFIGKGISADEKKVAVDFIQFAYTDTSLAEFSRITDTTKAVRYKLSDKQKAEMSAYGRSILEVQEKADIVYPFSDSSFFQNNDTYFSDTINLYYTKDGNNPANAFKTGKSAKTYFDDVYSYMKNTTWRTLAKG